MRTYASSDKPGFNTATGSIELFTGLGREVGIFVLDGMNLVSCDTLHWPSTCTWSIDIPIITTVKKKPIPTTTPYPTACGNTVETVSDIVDSAECGQDSETEPSTRQESLRISMI